MKRLLPVFLLFLVACSPSDPVSTQPAISPNQTVSPTPQSSTTPAQVAPAPSPIVVSPSAVADSKSELIYTGTAYLKGLGIQDDGSYESHVSFQGSATLLPDDKLHLRLSIECGEASRPSQSSEIEIQLNPKTKTWKQLSDKYEDCEGFTGILYENDDEQYQPYTTEDLGTKVKFNLGTNGPDETYHFRDLYGVTVNKQGIDPN
jgi:hypothetical protein